MVQKIYGYINEIFLILAYPFLTAFVIEERALIPSALLKLTIAI
jgi:hypothetical protein